MAVLGNLREIVTGSPHQPQSSVTRIPNGAIAWRKGTVQWIGPESELPPQFASEQRIDGERKLAIPGLIDCHTHLAFAGWRTAEFEQKILGKGYLEIAEAGGGILSTVAKTRAATSEELKACASAFLAQMQALGVTTIEAKSGYGLSLRDELKLLQVYRELSESTPVTIVPTLLAAHTVPAEFRKNREGYIDLITEELLPEVSRQKLASFCDVFVEEGAFTPDEARLICAAARTHGLGVKLHVDQLSDGRGALLAAELEAISADHLEHISAEGAAALVERGVVAVALPIASLYTHQRAVNARMLRKAGAPVAVATDFNPGTAPICHLPLAMMLGCTLNRLTPIEVLNGATWVAAKAIGLGEAVGALDVGMRADIALLDAESIEHWMYHFKPNACVMTFKAGVRVH